MQHPERKNTKAFLNFLQRARELDLGGGEEPPAAPLLAHLCTYTERESLASCFTCWLSSPSQWEAGHSPANLSGALERKTYLIKNYLVKRHFIPMLF